MVEHKRISRTESKSASEFATTIEHDAEAANYGFDKTLVGMKEGIEAEGLETCR
jgi:hypothetical protein